MSVLQVFEDNMKQKQVQLQQLRENLLRLIEEHPDSPEAEKWKHMLAQIGMHPSHPKPIIYICSSVCMARCRFTHFSSAPTVSWSQAPVKAQALNQCSSKWCVLCSTHRCRMGGGQGHDGDPETAPGGVVPHAGALPDDPTAALAVAAGEGVDDGRPGAFVCGPKHA